MKKYFFILATLFFSVNVLAQAEKVEKPKLKFKHSAGPTHCMNCHCPLGICIQINFKMSPITTEETNDGYGYVSASIVKGKLNVIFENPAALEDGTIPIEEDWVLSPEFAKYLGLNSITVKGGVYKVDFSRNQNFGEIFLDILSTD